MNHLAAKSLFQTPKTVYNEYILKYHYCSLPIYSAIPRTDQREHVGNVTSVKYGDDYGFGL